MKKFFTAIVCCALIVANVYAQESVVEAPAAGDIALASAQEPIQDAQKSANDVVAPATTESTHVIQEVAAPAADGAAVQGTPVVEGTAPVVQGAPIIEGAAPVVQGAPIIEGAAPAMEGTVYSGAGCGGCAPVTSYAAPVTSYAAPTASGCCDSCCIAQPACCPCPGRGFSRPYVVRVGRFSSFRRNNCCYCY